MVEQSRVRCDRFVRRIIVLNKQPYSTYFARYPEERVIIVVFSNLMLSPVAKIAKALAAIVFGEPNELSQ